MAFVKNHAYGEEVLGKGTIRLQTINSVFVEFMFGERVGEIRMLCQEDVYAVISLELISDESLAVFESLEEFNDVISIFFSVKRSKDDHLDVIEEIMSLTDEQKRQVIPQLASVANQRLRELEKQGETRWAYVRAAKDLALPKGATPRFSYSTTKLKRKAALDNYLSSILRFLNSESSTVTGIRAINKRRVQAFKEKAECLQL